MTTNQMQTTGDKTLLAAVEQAITAGNLAALNPAQRLFYYNQVCESVGLNPLTRPLDFIQLNGKLVLYAKKDATDQIRKLHGVSITCVEQTIQEGCCIVTAFAKDKNGKEDSDMGVVPLKGLSGDAYANAIMKAVTKAKRRVTLSICGMGLLDESELDTVKDAQPMPIDMSVKTVAQVENLKAKLNPVGPGAISTSKEEAYMKPLAESDTPPPVPAAAKSPIKEPEVLPAAKKPGRPPNAKPAAPAKAAPAPKPEPLAWPEDLGTVPVLYARFKGKTLSDLDDAQLLEVIAWAEKGVKVEKWEGPNFTTFKAQLDKYSEGYGDKFNTEPGMDEPEEIPPPADEIESFMETPYAEVEKAVSAKPATPWDVAMGKIKFAKNKEEFDVACTEFKKSGKVLFSGMDAPTAALKLKEAQAIRDKRKAELETK